MIPNNAQIIPPIQIIPNPNAPKNSILGITLKIGCILFIVFCIITIFAIIIIARIFNSFFPSVPVTNDEEILVTNQVSAIFNSICNDTKNGNAIQADLNNIDKELLKKQLKGCLQFENITNTNWFKSNANTLTFSGTATFKLPVNRDQKYTFTFYRDNSIPKGVLRDIAIVH